MSDDLFSYAESRKYPEVPGSKAAGTSAEAAVAIEPEAALRRRQCIEVLRTGDFTADEVAGKLGLSVLAIRPRMSELKLKKRIEPTGERRRNASGLNAAVMRISK